MEKQRLYGVAVPARFFELSGLPHGVRPSQAVEHIARYGTPELSEEEHLELMSIIDELAKRYAK